VAEQREGRVAILRKQKGASGRSEKRIKISTGVALRTTLIRSIGQRAIVHHTFTMCCVPQRRRAQKPSFTDWCSTKSLANELAFYRAVVEFQSKTCSASELRGTAKSIYNQFIAPGAPNEVYLSPQAQQAIKQRLRKPTHSIFQQASFEMVTVLQPILLDFARAYKIHHKPGLESLARLQLSQSKKSN
jgi:hypothetical protein